MLEDDQQMLIDIEQNIANIERSLAVDHQGTISSASDKRGRTMKRASTIAATDKSPGQDKRRSTLKSMKSLMRLVSHDEYFF